jgi:trk system potassium uptake protein TrkH
VLTAWRIFAHDLSGFEALTNVAFNVVSIVTTTGYASGDYTLWGSLSVAVFMVLMFFGGCTGSTTGGMKIFRLQVMMMAVGAYLKRLSTPHRVVTMVYENRTVTADIAMAVFAYLSVMLVTVALLAVGLAFTGLDFITALSGAITAVANVGPGLGPVIGPAGTFTSLPDAAKIMLSVGMLLGRLEFFTLLVVLHPRFWK